MVVTVLKQAEDNDVDDIIVRAFEAHGVPTPATITLSPALGGRTIEASFGASEIKTFRVPCDSAKPVVEVDLLERTAE